MSIENDIEENKKRLELLKLARHMVNEQYLKDRASAYVQWSTDSDRAWKEQGIKLPFPPTPAMPSEADVVAKALDLYNHLNAPKESAPAAPTVVEVADEPPVVTDEALLQPQPMVQDSISNSPPVEEVSIVETPAPAPVETPAPAPVETPAPIVPEIAQPVINAVPGAADKDVAETAIKEIFSTPATDPVLVPSNPPRSESVVPLIKGMLKKGLLPSWIKPDNLAEDTK